MDGGTIGLLPRLLSGQLFDQLNGLVHVERLHQVRSVGRDSLTRARPAEVSGHQRGSVVEGGHRLELLEKDEPISRHSGVDQSDVKMLLLCELKSLVRVAGLRDFVASAVQEQRDRETESRFVVGNEDVEYALG